MNDRHYQTTAPSWDPSERQQDTRTRTRVCHGNDCPHAPIAGFNVLTLLPRQNHQFIVRRALQKPLAH